MTTIHLDLLPKPGDDLPGTARLKFDVFVGIDPGAQGGIAFYMPLTNTLICRKMPLRDDGQVDGGALHKLISDACILWQPRVLVERVGGSPRQQGQFQFGLNTGVVHGVLGAVGCPWATIHPVQWKGLVGLAGGDPNTKKARAIQLAIALFPEQEPTIRKHDGMAEAALLAYINAYRLSAVESKLTQYGGFCG